jgi:hypothetical protein
MYCQVSPRQECNRRLTASAFVLLRRFCQETTLRNWSAEISCPFARRTSGALKRSAMLLYSVGHSLHIVSAEFPA